MKIMDHIVHAMHQRFKNISNIIEIGHLFLLEKHSSFTNDE